MVHRKNKGDRAERECAELVTGLLGRTCRRRLSEGRKADESDLEIKGLPIAIQVANWADTAAAAIQKPPQAQQQAVNSESRFAATFVRFRGKKWRVVLTPEQWADLISEIYGIN